MNFEDFKARLEENLKSFTAFELQEFSYHPYSFGSGLVAYRIKGSLHKFVFDGRDENLTWYKSKPHQKYSSASWDEYLTISSLDLSIADLVKGINSVK